MKTWTLGMGGVLLAGTLFAQSPNAGEAEAQRCEERIAAVQRDVLAKYSDGLADLLASLQKSADLEGALAVRAEKERSRKEGVLSEKNLGNEPKALRTLQMQTLAKMQELTAQLVNDTVPKLVELKKSLTVAGRLDDAVAVRSAIERLQNGFVPVSRVDPGMTVAADTLLNAYGADKGRADKTYKGQKFAVRGVVGGFRPDPADAKNYLVYLTGSGGTGWVQCALMGNEFLFREEKQFNNVVLVVIAKDKDATITRLSKGAAAELLGTCDGLDELVRMNRCTVAR